MHRMLRIANAIDRFNERFGRLLYWLTLAMVVIGSYNALGRYLDRYTGWGLSSNMYLELQWYLFSLVFLLGAAYTLKHEGHVRVDVLYTHLGRRGKAIINLAGVVLLLIPFCVLMIKVSIPSVINSWTVLETSPDPGGLPRFPLKTIIPIAFLLVIVQGVSMGIRQLAVLLGIEPAEGTESEPGSLEEGT